MRYILLISLVLVFGCRRKEMISYYPDGAIKYKAEVVDEILDGTLSEFYPNGKLKKEVFFKKGVKDGVLRIYYENGRIKQEEHYDNGVLTDTTKFYYPTGEIKQTITYSEGKRNGDIRSFYKNGNLISTLPYVKGEMLGIEKQYYETGQLSMLRTWIKVQGESLPNGIIYYNVNGKIDSVDHIVKLSSPKDTISLGEQYELTIKLEGAYNKNMKVMIGKFDEVYNLLDSVNVDTIHAKNYTAVHAYKPRSTGLNVVRGIVEDYEVGFTPEGNKIYYFTRTYFTKEFFVKPPALSTLSGASL